MTSILDQWATHRKACHMETESEILGDKLAKRVADLEDALRWISSRCPKEQSLRFVDQPCKFSGEAMHDAGECARSSRQALKETTDD